MNIVHELESLNFSSIEPEDILYVITSHLNLPAITSMNELQEQYPELFI